MTASMKKHHLRDELCLTRARYREGRQLKAVKVYTINQESQYLLIQGVPALGTKDDLLRTFSKHGRILEDRVLDEYPAEEFTEVYLIKYERIQSARVAKRKMDDTSFYGGVLHVCYAPEYETVQETRSKLQERRWAVSRRLKQLEAERQKQKPVPTMKEIDEQNDADSHTSKQRIESHTEDTQQFTCNQMSSGVPDFNPSALDIHQWPARPPSVSHGSQFVQEDRTRYPSLPHPSTNQYFYPPLPLPPPPQNMFPWQRPPTRPRFDHARVPSAHATLPPWIDQEQSSHEFIATIGQQSATDTMEQNKQCFTENTTAIKKWDTTAEQTSSTPNNTEPTVIKSYECKGAKPRFVPHQVTKKRICTFNKEDFRRSIKDAVNESLRRNAFILDDVSTGPHLPPAQERKRQEFRNSDVCNKSLESTVTSIRNKVKQFSASLIPRQVKRQKLS